jgi:hypothetical protein
LTESVVHAHLSFDPTVYHNCTFAHNAIGPGWPVLDHDRTGNVSIERSIVAEPGHQTLWFTPSSFVTGAFARADHLLSNDLSSFPEARNDPTLVVADPMFANAQEGDFHLRRGSPALDFSLPEFNTTTLDFFSILEMTMFPVDLISAVNRFGIEDLGPYEHTNTDRIFASGIGDEAPLVYSTCRFTCP